MTTQVIAMSGPRITAFGAAVTQGKVGGDAIQSEGTIKGIISTWRQYLGAELQNILKEFCAGVKEVGVAARASAHMVVNWLGNFQLIHDLFDFFEFLVYGRVRDRKRDFWRQWRKKLGFSKT